MGTYNVGWEDGTTQVFAARDDEDARLQIQSTVIEMERDDPPGPWSDVRFLRDADSARDVPDPLAQIRRLLGRHAKHTLTTTTRTRRSLTATSCSPSAPNIKRRWTRSRPPKRLRWLTACVSVRRLEPARVGKQRHRDVAKPARRSAAQRSRRATRPASADRAPRGRGRRRPTHPGQPRRARAATARGRTPWRDRGIDPGKGGCLRSAHAALPASQPDNS